MEKEILIELDREKTAAAGLNIYELAQELGGDNFTMASGTVRDGSRKLLLRSVARYRQPGGSWRTGWSARSVRLGDIATISYEEPERGVPRAGDEQAGRRRGRASRRARPTSARSPSAVDAAVASGSRPTRGCAGCEMLTLFSQGEVIDEALATLLELGHDRRHHRRAWCCSCSCAASG